MALTGLAAVALALVCDSLAGEPPASLHPVAWFGRVVAPFDREWSRPALVGGLLAFGLPVGAALAAAAAVAGAAAIHPLAAAAVAGLALFVTTSRRMLLDVARDVTERSARDLDAARDELLALAGRDASALSPGEVRSAAAESAAENLADGLVAPLLGFALLAPVSLPAAAGAAAWVKAVNTLDSMLGYRSKPVGRLPARLDDVVMWLPARLSALFVAVAAGSLGALSAARADARAPPSPNSGWPMATLAAALDARFDKPGAYVLNAEAALPSVETAARGVRVVARASLLAFVLAGVVAWL